MPALIPDATLGATYTNEITGITYTYDGQKWVAESSSSADDYVSKSGDTMTGALLVEADATSKFTGQTSALACYGGPDASDGTYVFYAYSAPYQDPDGDEGETQKDLIFGVVNDGRLFGKAGHLPTSGSQLANKQYVDNQDNERVKGPGFEITKSDGVYYISG